MTADDFEYEPPGTRLFGRWIARERVGTPFGEFEIVAHVAMEESTPPDDLMVRQASELAAFARTSPEAILAKIHAHYRVFQPFSLDMCDVPHGLAEDALTPYLIHRSIVVDRDGAEPTIYVVPQWDEEHGIMMVVRDGRVEFRED